MKISRTFLFCFSFFILSGICFPQDQNIVVNTSQFTTVSEPAIAINPTDPNNIVIGTNNTFYFTTFDGGSTWTEGRMYSTMGTWGDPSLVFDSNGILYYAHLSGEPPLTGRWVDRIVIQKSTDGGLTWNDGTFTGLNRPKHEDKEWIAVDLTNSEHHNNLYVAWTEFDQVFAQDPKFKSRELFSRSTDGGETWSDPIKLNTVEGDCLDDDNTIQGATPTVGPNGEVYLAWSGPEGILFDRSFDGGVTFGDDIFVVDNIGGWGWGYEVPGIFGNGLPQTYCDLSNSDYRGTVYILWADQRNGTSNTDIFLIKSTDHGNTWSEIKQVNDDETDRPQFFPWMTIDPATGVMYIIYYDRRSTLNTLTEVYCARSIDGGNTFENFLISDSPFEAQQDKFIGDYINIAAINGKAYGTWVRSDQFGRSILMTIIDDTPNSIDDEGTISDYVLNQNYPNPFNPTTTIKFSLPERSAGTPNTSLIVYDLLGNKVVTLVDEKLAAGSYEVSFDARLKNENVTDFSSGVYFYRLQSGEFTQTNKMILQK